MLSKFGRGLKKTRQILNGSVAGLKSLFSQQKLDDNAFEELEEALILADIGAETSSEIIAELKITSDDKPIRQLLADIITGRFSNSGHGDEANKAKPRIILVVGVNGSGKTTTIAKLARNEINSGGKVILAAADTFRAAAGEQLEHWADLVGAELIKQSSGSDPAAVAFDAVKAGVARNSSMVIIDTAGRLQTKSNLMEELKKINRVIGKAMDGAPHEVFMVMDATTGQNGLSQVKTFNEAVGLTGIIVTKLDGTAKGGVLVAAFERFGIPIKYVGVGEKQEDLIEFDPRQFAEALVGIDE
ncbi:MAG: signal recognition particle-docking protein FtsY [candidate division Zixibacteria bacterium]